MLRMSRKKLQKILDFEQIQTAIAQAESQTSGEIRVSIAPWFWGNIEHAADRAFIRLGMTNTQERNAVLFFIVPARRTFVVLGDQGIHEKVGQQFWDRIAALLTQHFLRGQFNEGLLKALEELGPELRRHFPHAGHRDQNELPDHVDVN